MPTYKITFCCTLCIMAPTLKTNGLDCPMALHFFYSAISVHCENNAITTKYTVIFSEKIFSELCKENKDLGQTYGTDLPQIYLYQIRNQIIMKHYLQHTENSGNIKSNCCKYE